MSCLNAILVFVFIFGGALAHGDGSDFDGVVPQVDGVNLDAIPTDSEGTPLSLPPALKLVEKRHEQDARLAPHWVKKLWTKKVKDYFSSNIDPTSPLPQQDLEKLLVDATNLHNYFEQDNTSDEFKGFASGYLRPFVMSLTPKKILASVRNGIATQPIGEWTVETLVVIKQITALTKYPNFIKRSMELVTGPHLKGATKLAVRIVMAAAVGYTVYKLSGGMFIAGMVVGAIQAGPLAALINAGTSWFLNPTTEFIRVVNARFTGGWEQKINNYFDRWKPTAPQSEEEATKRNDRPRVADLDQDGMNFAFMTPEDQAYNWDNSLVRWVAVAKRFGQLLRDTHHQGRVLMMVSWQDEQNSTQLIETMDVKLVNLNMEVELLMTPYKTALLMRNETEKKDELVSLFDTLQDLCESTWMSFNMQEAEVTGITEKIEAIQKQLQERGVSLRDLLRLNNIQVERAKAVGTIVTGLTINEIRSFSVAEANRNLEEEARKAQREVRKGLHLQSYVEKYLPLVQEQMRRMGYGNSGAKPTPKDKCESLLSRRTFPAIPVR